MYATDYKQNNMRPKKPVGLVIVNAIVDHGQVGVAAQNKNGYWGPADGLHRDDWATVETGSIGFAYHTKKECAMNCYNSDPFNLRQESSTVKSIDKLNGQGDASQEDGNYQLMGKIRVTGIVEEGTSENKKERFNLRKRGIFDIRINGTKSINNGQKVMAYAPSREEAGKGGGSNRTEAEKAGVVSLWYMPYDQDIHRNQLKQIYNCLSDIKNSRYYLPSYKMHCRQMMDSVLGMSMVVLAKYLPILKKAKLTDATPDAVILHKFLMDSGHSEFEPTNAALHAEIRNALFHPYSTDEKNSSDAYRLFQTVGQPKNEERLTRFKEGLNKIQSKSTSQFLESTAAFVETVDNLIIGTAVTSGRPGDMIALQADID